MDNEDASPPKKVSDLLNVGGTNFLLVKKYSPPLRETEEDSGMIQPEVNVIVHETDKSTIRKYGGGALLTAAAAGAMLWWYTSQND